MSKNVEIGPKLAIFYFISNIDFPAAKESEVHMKQNFVNLHPISTFLVILESGGQEESVDTHIGHF